jgi:hypothetical protein
MFKMKRPEGYLAPKFIVPGYETGEFCSLLGICVANMGADYNFSVSIFCFLLKVGSEEDTEDKKI